MFGREIKGGMGNITRSFWMILRAWMYEFCKQQKGTNFLPNYKSKIWQYEETYNGIGVICCDFWRGCLCRLKSFNQLPIFHTQILF